MLYRWIFLKIPGFIVAHGFSETIQNFIYLGQARVYWSHAISMTIG